MSPLFLALNLEEMKEKLTLKTMPDMTMPVPGWIAYALLGLGAIFLLCFFWRMITFRPFRAFFSFIAAILVAYYPLAYGVHWWLHKYDEEAKQQRDQTKLEAFVEKNCKYIDWGIMGTGFFLGTIIFYYTCGEEKKSRNEEDEDDDENYVSPQERLQQARQQQAQQQGRSSQARSRAKPPKPEKNPFDFT